MKLDWNGASPLVWRSAIALLLLAAYSGCRTGRTNHDSRFTELRQDIQWATTTGGDAASALSPEVAEWALPRSVEELVQLGLQQNPEITEARLRVESAAARVIQAASLPDPVLGSTVYPAPVETAAGRQQLALALNQKVPWRGKLDLQAQIAEDEVNAARARLAAVELKVAQQIRDAYYQLQYIEQAIDIIRQDRKQLELIGQVVEQMFRVKRSVTQQDVLQVQVALSRLETELVQLAQQQTTAQARLARLLHVSPETRFQTTDPVEPGQLAMNIQQLYEIAIESRPELHAQLAAIEKNRHAATLAELQNYPDLTFGMNWIATSNSGISPVANGDDAFMLSLGMNLPIYKKRIVAGVREAQTRALAEARRYDLLKDETMADVADLFANIASQRETLRLFRDDIIPKQELTLSQSLDDYKVSKVDFLQLIDNWRQLLRFRLTERRLQSDLSKTIAALARQLGEFDLDAVAPTGMNPDPTGGTPQNGQSDEPTLEPMPADPEDDNSLPLNPPSAEDDEGQLPF